LLTKMYFPFPSIIGYYMALTRWVFLISDN
jgi:hypothetical protein